MIKTNNDNDNSKNKQKIMENKTKEENKIQSSQVFKLETQNMMPNLPSTHYYSRPVRNNWLKIFQHYKIM